MLKEYVNENDSAIDDEKENAEARNPKYM